MNWLEEYAAEEWWRCVNAGGTAEEIAERYRQAERRITRIFNRKCRSCAIRDLECPLE